MALMDAWPGAPPSSNYGLGPDYPVYFVSWNDAQHYLSALNAYFIESGQDVAIARLPSEAEWEYACRPGAATRFAWGDDPEYTHLGEYAWYENGICIYGTKPVGGKLPNAFGLHDMNGNVWEWCQDWYGPYPQGSVTDPSGPSAGMFRILRGGSWVHFPRHCRSAYRNYCSPNMRTFLYGFRIAVSEAQRSRLVRVL